MIINDSYNCSNSTLCIGEDTVLIGEFMLLTRVAAQRGRRREEACPEER